MREGNNVALDVLEHDFAVHSPWLDFTWLGYRKVSVERLQANSMAWLEVSDAVLLVPGWEHSKGTAAELRRASELGIPVFESLTELQSWATSRPKEKTL